MHARSQAPAGSPRDGGAWEGTSAFTNTTWTAQGTEAASTTLSDKRQKANVQTAAVRRQLPSEGGARRGRDDKGRYLRAHRAMVVTRKSSQTPAERGQPAHCPRGFPGGSSFLERGRQCLAFSRPVSIVDLCNSGSRSYLVKQMSFPIPIYHSYRGAHVGVLSLMGARRPLTLHLCSPVLGLVRNFSLASRVPN